MTNKVDKTVCSASLINLNLQQFMSKRLHNGSSKRLFKKLGSTVKLCTFFVTLITKKVEIVETTHVLITLIWDSFAFSHKPCTLRNTVHDFTPLIIQSLTSIPKWWVSRTSVIKLQQWVANGKFENTRRTALTSECSVRGVLPEEINYFN